MDIVDSSWPWIVRVESAKLCFNLYLVNKYYKLNSDDGCGLNILDCEY